MGLWATLLQSDFVQSKEQKRIILNLCSYMMKSKLIVPMNNAKCLAPLMSGFVNWQHVCICADLYPNVGGCVFDMSFRDSSLPIQWLKSYLLLVTLAERGCVFWAWTWWLPWCVRTSQISPQSGSLCSGAWGMCVTEIGIGISSLTTFGLVLLPSLSVQHLLDYNHSHAPINILDVVHAHVLSFIKYPKPCSSKCDAHKITNFNGYFQLLWHDKKLREASIY